MIIDKLPLLAASALVVVAATAEPSRESAPPNAEEILRGTVEQWRLDMHGTVYIQLRHTDPDADEGESSPEVLSWLRSPPPRTPTVNVEEMLLGILLSIDAAQQSPPVLVAVQDERGLDGDDPEDALPIVWFGRP